MDLEEKTSSQLVLATVAVKQFLDHVIEEESTSESEREVDDDININLFISFISLGSETHRRQSGYKFVIESYSDADFWRHFRVTRSTFKKICDLQGDSGFLNDVVYHGGYQPVSLDTMLYITLSYLGNQGAIRLIADKFGYSESTIWRVVQTECQWFFDNQARFIRWPTSDNARAIARRFQKKRGFPGDVGAIDGCHIPIHPPSANRRAYLNYKRFHSIVLMAVCLPNKSFSYIFTGFPGSCHDSYVFQRSSLFRRLDSDNCGQILNSQNYHLIGDSAFPLKKWLLVPYKFQENLSESQKLYNKKLSGTRIVVEQAFGDLKMRFRRCQKVHATVENSVKVVVASCVLHNIGIENGDFCIGRTDPDGDGNSDGNLPERNFVPTNSGQAKRESVRQKLARIFL